MRRRMPTELPPRHDVFLKCRHSPGPRQQDQRVMLTLMTDLVLMECALLHHINAGFFPTMLFSLDQALYFHADVSTEDWLLCEVRSPVAGEWVLAGNPAQRPAAPSRSAASGARTDAWWRVRRRKASSASTPSTPAVRRRRNPLRARQ